MTWNQATPRTAAVLLLAALLAGPAAAVEPLTLRISDAVGEPGGLVAVVVRTYASKGVGQGQIVFGPPGGRPVAAGDTPFAALEQVLVFSQGGDAGFTWSWDPVTQILDVTFDSPSASINEVGGPLLVALYELNADLAPGSTFPLTMDLGSTALSDGAGNPIPIELRGGDLTIRAREDPLTAEAEGDEVYLGHPAVLGMGTLEPFPISAGQIAISFDPEVVDGPLAITMDSRHGAASYSVDDSQPGLVVVSFVSPDDSLNALTPGELVSVTFVTDRDHPPGDVPVVLDPALAWLVDGQGNEVPLAFVSDVLELVQPDYVLTDDFETGDLSRWSTHKQ